MSLEKIIANAYKIIAESKFGSNSPTQATQPAYKK